MGTKSPPSRRNSTRARRRTRCWSSTAIRNRRPATPRQPRVFADGLAIPLGILPYKNGAYVQHGTDIVFLSDTDGDGKADKREVILSGFGVQDSHLFPHQFTRAPGNWIWMAQGAFNYGKVQDDARHGSEVRPDAHGEVSLRRQRLRHHLARPVQHLGTRAHGGGRGVDSGGERLRLSRDALPRIRELSRLLRFAVEKLRAGIPGHRAGFQDGRHGPEWAGADGYVERK